MATMVATRRNKVIPTFCERLVKPGKRMEVALSACMRKLLTMLEAMVKSKTRWGPPHRRQRLRWVLRHFCQEILWSE